MPVAFFSRPRRVLLLATAFLVPLASAAPPRPRLDQVFDVKHGAMHGGCEHHMAQLQQWWEDSAELMDAALRRAEQARTDRESRRYLDVFFKVHWRSRTWNSESNPVVYMERVRDIMAGQFFPEDIKPPLYCNDKWAIAQQWTDVARDRKPPYGPREDGRTVADVCGNIHEEDGQLGPAEVPMWLPDFAVYTTFEITNVNMCRRSRRPINYGHVTWCKWPEVPMVTLCAENIIRDRRRALADLAPVEQPGVSIAKPCREIGAIVLLHEIFHLVLPERGVDHTYKLPGCLRLGAKQAMENPESYVFFAFAAWLAETNKEYSFASGFASGRSSPVPPAQAPAHEPAPAGAAVEGMTHQRKPQKKSTWRNVRKHVLHCFGHQHGAAHG